MTATSIIISQFTASELPENFIFGQENLFISFLTFT